MLTKERIRDSGYNDLKTYRKLLQETTISINW